MRAHRFASMALKRISVPPGRKVLSAYSRSTWDALLAQLFKLFVHFSRAPGSGRRGHDIAQIEGDHGHPCRQGSIYVLDCLEVVPVRPVPAIVALLEDEERRVGDDAAEIRPVSVSSLMDCWASTGAMSYLAAARR